MPDLRPWEIGDERARWRGYLNPDTGLLQVRPHPQPADVDERLTLPHPRAAERAFVLAPWLAADPDGRLPRLTASKDRTLADDVGLRVRDLLDELPEPDRESVRPGPEWPAFVHELVMVAPR